MLTDSQPQAPPSKKHSMVHRTYSNPAQQNYFQYDFKKCASFLGN